MGYHALTPRFTGKGDALPAGNTPDATWTPTRQDNVKIARVPLVRCKRIVIVPFLFLILLVDTPPSLE
jgi:hypothetical protein